MNGVRESKKNDIGVDLLLREETLIFLHVLDDLWMGHLESMDQLKKGIGLQALGQKDPAVEYATAGYEMFENLLAEIRKQTVKYIFGINIIDEDGDGSPEEILVGGEE
jgi:preprotein translocase subunit SecA